jgi:hypothetical protein
MVEAPQEQNVVLFNIESILVEETDSNAIYSISRQKGNRSSFMPTEFFTDEHGNRWVKFWPKNGPAKGKQMSIPIERLIGVIHK